MNSSSSILQIMIMYIFAACIAVVFAARFWSGKEKGFSKLKGISRIILRRIVPVLMVLASIYMVYSPIHDYINNDYIHEKGTLEKVNFDSSKPYKYSIVIDDELYTVSSDVKDSLQLHKGAQYRFVYSNKSKIIIEIYEVEGKIQ